MGKTYDAIDENLSAWLLEQPIYFVGTAPLSTDGLVNVSPKGGFGTFAVLGETTVAYLDIAGSGAETIAHLRENGRVVIMFCAFQGRPKIMRLHGQGRAIQTGEGRFDQLLSAFPNSDVPKEGLRSIILVEVERIASSCGYSVPLMSFEGWRPNRDLWIDKKLKDSPDGVKEYIRERNTVSLDGLPAVDPELL